MSIGQIYFKFFFSTGHCAVSYRSSHKFMMFRRQKHIEQYLPDQALNEGCPTNKFPLTLTFS
jgi:hypothetical protein